MDLGTMSRLKYNTLFLKQISFFLYLCITFMVMSKKIKINKPVPDRIKEAIKEKQDWIKKAQTGGIVISSKPKRIA